MKNLTRFILMFFIVGGLFLSKVYAMEPGLIGNLLGNNSVLKRPAAFQINSGQAKLQLDFIIGALRHFDRNAATSASRRVNLDIFNQLLQNMHSVPVFVIARHEGKEIYAPRQFLQPGRRGTLGLLAKQVAEAGYEINPEIVRLFTPLAVYRMFSTSLSISRGCLNPGTIRKVPGFFIFR